MTAIGELVQTQQGKFKIQQPQNGLGYFLIKVSLLLDFLNLKMTVNIFRCLIINFEIQLHTFIWLLLIGLKLSNAKLKSNPV